MEYLFCTGLKESSTSFIKWNNGGVNGNPCCKLRRPVILEFSRGMYFFVKKVGMVWRGFDGRGDLTPRVSRLEG